VNSKLSNLLFRILPLVLFAFAASANEGGHGEHSAGLDEHTIKTIIYQAINVCALVAGLIYFLKVPVQKFFTEKKAEYVAAANRAQQARKLAEEEHLQIQIRLNKLESTADESVSRAKAEAAEMKNQLIHEASAISKRIREEAILAAKLEVEKAKHQLRDELIKEAFIQAKENLESKVSLEDHTRLQGEFINNIQAAQR
jgi:F0F1-type ATP synthase membrane subunit b/b'